MDRFQLFEFFQIKTDDYIAPYYDVVRSVPDFPDPPTKIGFNLSLPPVSEFLSHR